MRQGRNPAAYDQTTVYMADGYARSALYTAEGIGKAFPASCDDFVDIVCCLC